MKNSVSEQSFYLESEEDDDDEKVYDKVENGNDSDSSSYSNDNDDENRQQSKGGSLSPSWPQSYRQSIDLYGSVPSQSINFLGPQSLSRFGSSFLSSSLIRKRTPEVLPSLIKPLIPAEEGDKQKEGRSSHSLLSPTLSRKSSLRKAVLDKRASIEHGLPLSRRSTFGQAVINGMNIICGVGLLSTPYAVREGGWLGLSILLILPYFLTTLEFSYDTVWTVNLGSKLTQTSARLPLALQDIVLYVELYACCVEYIILESDNLSSLFPNAHLNLGGYELNSQHLFALITTLAVLPTVWLRDLSILSYISVGGVIASILVVACLFWVGLVDEVGVHTKGTTLNLSTLPVAIGLYGFCYSGHAVIPNIYSSMEKPSQFPFVLLTSFGICTVMYAGAATMGYVMFGELTQSQFTLNMPHDLVASKIAVWTTVVNPFTKYPSYDSICLVSALVDIDSSMRLLLDHPKGENNFIPGVVSSALGTYSALSKIVEGLS
ncbi:hypothetical protein DH2020_030082 [Rehmannia glutinosa]|uniref:Amino acid transporter transmembrane domain-containing protein n=1 Tax=Rehmannia glutinosa TaxID=99300 RepID=A0ABR0VLU6_REHGL